MEFGEVYICRFPFTDGEMSKSRPAVVLFDFGDDVVICRVTSKERDGQLDVNLTEWKQVGLERPSVARLDRLVTASKDTLTSHLGQLSAANAESLRSAWNKNMRL